MTKTARITVDSWEQLQERLSSIVDELNKNPRLALAESANPLEALEELGCYAQTEARPAIADRLRFTPSRTHTSQAAAGTAGRARRTYFAPGDPGAVRNVLSDKLEITLYPGARGYSPHPSSKELPRRDASGAKSTDPSRALEGRHPITSFGRQIRTAYQLVDDVLAADDRATRLGRAMTPNPSGGFHGFPTVHALHTGMRSELVDALAPAKRGAGVAERVRSLVRQAGGLKAAFAEAARLLDRAKSALAALPEGVARSWILPLTDFVRRRGDGRHTHDTIHAPVDLLIGGAPRCIALEASA